MADTKPTPPKAGTKPKPGTKPAPKGIKGKLNHEAGIGPVKLPLWGWGAVAIGAYWLWFHVIQPYNAAQDDTESLNTPGPGTGMAGGGSNAGGGGSIGGGGGNQSHHHGAHKHRHAHDKPHHHRRQTPKAFNPRQAPNVRHNPVAPTRKHAKR